MHRARRRLAVLAAALAATAAAAFGAVAQTATPTHELFVHMAPSKVTDPVINRVAPGGAPWILSSGTARFRTDGLFVVRVRGLLIPDVGVGPVTTVSATLYCAGKPVFTTQPAPFSTTGDATMRGVFTPASHRRCLAPTVLVHPNGLDDIYIAASGFRL